MKQLYMRIKSIEEKVPILFISTKKSIPAYVTTPMRTTKKGSNIFARRVHENDCRMKNGERRKKISFEF